MDCCHNYRNLFNNLVDSSFDALPVASAKTVRPTLLSDETAAITWIITASQPLSSLIILLMPLTCPPIRLSIISKLLFSSIDISSNFPSLYPRRGMSVLWLGEVNNTIQYTHTGI